MVYAGTSVCPRGIGCCFFAGTQVQAIACPDHLFFHCNRPVFRCLAIQDARLDRMDGEKEEKVCDVGLRISSHWAFAPYSIFNLLIRLSPG